MKPLILSFFGALLIYSLFFDKEQERDVEQPRLNLQEYEQHLLKERADSVASLYVLPIDDLLTDYCTASF